MFRRILVTVEEMFCIVNHFPTMLNKVCHGFADHCLIFRHRRPEHLGDLKFPTFAENGYDRRRGLQQQTDLRVIFDLYIRPTGGPERGELRVF